MKIQGKLNPADLMTKNVGQMELEGHLRRLNIEYRDGRAAKAIELHGLQENVLMEDTRRKQVRQESAQQGKKIRDYWINLGDKTRRVHLRMRRALFPPLDMDAVTCPSAEVPMGTIRITEGVIEDGTHFLRRDNWTVPEDARRALIKTWTGTTTFLNES